MEYRDYWIRIKRDGVKVIDPTGLPAEGDFASDACCQTLSTAMAAIRNAAHSQGGNDNNSQQVSTLGESLFTFVFGTPQVRDHWDSAYRDAQRQGYGLRVHVVVDEYFCHDTLGRLAAIPWQFLKSPNTQNSNGFFFCSNSSLLFMVDLEISEKSTVRPAPPKKRLPILVVLSQPTDLGPVLGGPGLAAIRAAFEDKEAYNIEYLDEVTPQNMQERIDDLKPDVIHFIGHGRSTDEASELALVDDFGKAQWYPALNILQMLPPGLRVKLMTLVACEGAEQSSSRAFVGMASQLVRDNRVEAVVAMQYEISNAFAIDFTKSFYSRLIRCGWVDQALQKARTDLNLNPAYRTKRDFAAPALVIRGTLSQCPVINIIEPVDPSTLPSAKRPVNPVKLIGRDTLLETLKSQLLLGGVTILRGEGGIGKTSLAANAIDTLILEEKISGETLWIDCGHPDICQPWVEALLKGRVDKYLEDVSLIVFDSMELLPNAAEMLKWLDGGGKKWLENPDTRRNKHNVLIITRLFKSGLDRDRGKDPIWVPELDPDPAAKLFKERARNAGWKEAGMKPAHIQPLVEALCQSVGYLPLAIELLAKRAGGVSLQHLLESIWNDISILENRENQNPAWHTSITECFDKSLESISADARLILRRYSVPESIKSQVIDAVEMRPEWIYEAQELVSASVWRLNGDEYTMHPLMRQCINKWVLKRMEADRKMEPNETLSPAASARRPGV